MTNPMPTAGQDLVTRVRTVQSKVEEVSATATSADGAVTVTVNATGALRDVSFGPSAERLTRPGLAAAVLAAARAAQAKATAQVPAVLADLVGEHSETVRFLRAQAPPPARRAARAVPAAEPDDGQRPVLRRENW